MTPKQNRARQRALRKKRQRMAKKTPQVHTPKKSKAVLDGCKKLNAILRKLPEGALVEPQSDGRIKISMDAKRSESVAVRSRMVDLLESNGLIEAPEEETKDAEVCESEMQMERHSND